MKIQVTQEDCDSQSFGDPNDCMLARALNRATGDRFFVSTTQAQSYTRRHAVYNLPPAAIRARFDYDMRKRVQPFEFELEGYEL